MSVPVVFEADISRVRKTIDDLVAEARNRTVTIPLAAGGIGAGMAAAGGLPTAAGVFAASASLNVGSFASVAGSYGAGVGPGGGFAAGMATPGFFAATTTPTAAGIMGGQGAAQSGVDDGGFVGGYRGSSRFLGLRTSGLARYAAWGFVAREALRVGQGVSDYVDDTSLAANDQLKQTNAERGLYRTIASIPVVGQAADLVSNTIGRAFGIDKASTDKQLELASAQDARTARTQRTNELESSTRFESDSAADDEHGRRMRALEREHQQKIDFINKEAAAQRDADEKAEQNTQEAITKRNAKFDAIRLNENFRYAADTYIEGDDDAKRWARDNFASTQTTAGILADIDVDSANAAGNPRGALRARLRREVSRANAAAQIEADESPFNPMLQFQSILTQLKGESAMKALESGFTREDHFIHDDISAALGVAQWQWNRNPELAAILNIRHGNLGARRHLEETGDETGKGMLDQLEQQQIDLTHREFLEKRGDRLAALRGEGEVLTSQLGRGRDAGIIGTSTAIRVKAILASNQLRRSGETDAARQELQNAATQEQLLLESATNNARAVEVSRSNLQGGASGSTDDGRTQKEIADNVKAIRAAIEKVADPFGVR